jgi:hypothetical protein
MTLSVSAADVGSLTINDTSTGALTIAQLSGPASGTLTLSESGSGGITVTNGTSSATTIGFDNTGSGTLIAAALTDSSATSITGTGTLLGALYVAINDHVATAVTADFSGSAANNQISLALDNYAADLVILSNGNNDLTITNAVNVVANTDSVSFGSGANVIIDAIHTTGVHAYVNTVATGINSATVYSSITNTSSTAAIDTLRFMGDAVTAFDNSNLDAGAATVQDGITASLAALAPHQVGFFTGPGGNYYIFDHADNSSALTSADSLVEIVGPTAVVLGVPLNGTFTFH